MILLTETENVYVYVIATTAHALTKVYSNKQIQTLVYMYINEQIKNATIFVLNHMQFLYNKIGEKKKHRSYIHDIPR